MAAEPQTQNAGDVARIHEHNDDEISELLA